MIKFLRKNVLMSVAIVASTIAANAQTAAVDENFQSWTQAGYSAYTDCETNTIAKGSITIVKTYPSGQVTYKLDSAAVNPTCSFKAGTNATCTANSTVSPSYIYLDKNGGILTTSVFENVTTVELRASFTGSYRRTALLKSTDNGISWVSVDTTKGDNCTQYGETTSFNVNENNVRLRFIPVISNNPNTTNAIQNVRIHDLKIFGTIGGTTTTSVREALWSESLFLSVKDGSLTFSSDLSKGAVSVVSISGKEIVQKEVKQGEQYRFEIPSGFYIVRFTSEAGTFSKKVLVD